jgi:DNA modification methylase
LPYLRREASQLQAQEIGGGGGLTVYYQDHSVQLLNGDVLDMLKTLPNEYVQTVVTSPPYWGLRDYGTAKWEGGDAECQHQGMDARTVSGGAGKQYTNAGSNRVYSGDCACGAKRIDNQIGLEPTPDAYVAKMVQVFTEVRRVLKDDGTLWLNLGDSYGHGTSSTRKESVNGAVGGWKSEANQIQRNGIKAKDLVGIPWRVAFALQADGWYLRSDIIWAKPNPMPESVTDRPTKAHEYLFLMSKQERYWYDADAISEALSCEAHAPGNKKLDDSINDHGQMDKVWGANGKRNRRTVWSVTTQPYPEAHFATFPPKLIEPCILAGSKTGDTVLDPFHGAGTTAMVSKQFGRRYVGIELNPAYLELSMKRIQQEALPL